MAYCSNCGSEVSEFAQNCTECGASQNKNNNYNRPQRSYAPDTGGFGWGLLGFCVPIVGLVLYLVWKDERPRTSKAAGMGALISVIAGVIFYVIYFIFIFAMIGAGY
jgi:uncharacterized membrane protein YvbJ